MKELTVLRYNLKISLSQLKAQTGNSKELGAIRNTEAIIQIINPLIPTRDPSALLPEHLSIHAQPPQTLSEQVKQHPSECALLRTKLYNFLHDHSILSLIDDSLKLHINHFLIALAELMPINDNSCITLENIPFSRRIYTSSGYHFDLLEMSNFYKNNRFFHPYSNNDFSVLDTCHIINTIIEYQRQHQDVHLMEFLKTLGNPTKIEYINGLAFQMNDNHEPCALLEVSIIEMSLAPEKKRILSSNKNVMHCLYSNWIKLADLNDIPEKNLDLLNRFNKAVLMLQGEQGPVFLRNLKTKNHLDIFSLINEPSQDEKQDVVESSWCGIQ